MRFSHARSFHEQGHLIQAGGCLVPRCSLLLLISVVLSSCATVFCLGDIPIIDDRTVWNISLSRIAHINCEVTHARNLPVYRGKDNAQVLDLQRLGFILRDIDNGHGRFVYLMAIASSCVGLKL